MDNTNEKNERNAKNEASQKLSETEINQVKGGAAYIKFDGVDGECSVSSGPGGGMTGSTRRR